ncbi:hypothetical protein [Microcoleus sp. B9-D4]|uniref:hypothetical protein n=1 Tax=Microcoleus sp. B9-D4 TaxID=2818711 RepID=UPI002FD14F8D
MWILDCGFWESWRDRSSNLRNRVSWYISRLAPIFRRNPVSRPPTGFWILDFGFWIFDCARVGAIGLYNLRNPVSCYISR